MGKDRERAARRKDRRSFAVLHEERLHHPSYIQLHATAKVIDTELLLQVGRQNKKGKPEAGMKARVSYSLFQKNCNLSSQTICKALIELGAAGFWIKTPSPLRLKADGFDPTGEFEVSDKWRQPVPPG